MNNEALDEALMYLNNEAINEDEEIPELDYNLLVRIAESGLSIDQLMSFDETVADMLPGADIAKDVKQNVEELSDLRNQWKKAAGKFTMHKWISRYIKDEKQEQLLHKWYDTLTNPDVKYGEYKRAYTFFCNFFGIPNKGTIIEWMTFDKDKTDKGQKTVNIRYSRGLFRINLPDTVMLYHTSPVKGLKELVPSFRSKTQGKFFYPDNRVYFTVQKNINPFKYGMGTNKFIPTATAKLYKYTTKNPINVVYIDPTYAIFSERSVYVDTEKPIPIIDITGAKSNIFGKAMIDKR